jgi:hypothetical protein
VFNVDGYVNVDEFLKRMLFFQKNKFDRLTCSLSFLKEGRIVEEGTHQQLLERNGIYAQLVKQQQQQQQHSQHS